MNLKELKQMIGEEYRYWIAEQPGAGAPGAPPPNIPPAGAPGVEVGPDDVDVMGGGDDSEATLRQIYDMLKAYFEGGAAGAPVGEPTGEPAGEPAGDDMADMDAGDDLDASDLEDEEGDEEGDDEDKEALQERFKKLANIIKG